MTKTAVDQDKQASAPMKTCATCRFRGEDAMRGGSNWPCLRPHNPKYDMVTGDEVPRWCRFEREATRAMAETVAGGDICGRVGRYWEPDSTITPVSAVLAGLRAPADDAYHLLYALMMRTPR